MRTVVILPRDAEAPGEWLRLAAGRIEARGVLQAGAPQCLEGPIMAIAPGAAILTRRLELSARTQAQAQAAAGLLLADLMASDRAQSHIALGPAQTDDHRLACVVENTAMRALLQQCAAFGFDPDVLLPDHLLAPAPTEEDAACAIRFEGSLAVRARDVALTCEADLAPLILGERRLDILERPEALEAAVVAAAAQPPVNLRQGAFARRAPGRALDQRLLGLFAAGAAALALLVCAVPAISAYRHSVIAARVERQVRADMQTAAPALAAARDPLAALRRLPPAAAAAGPAFSGPAAALFAALEALPGTQLTSLVYTVESGLQVSLHSPGYAEVERLRQALADAGMSLEEGGTVTAPDGVVTELTVRPST